MSEITRTLGRVPRPISERRLCRIAMVALIVVGGAEQGWCGGSFMDAVGKVAVGAVTQGRPLKVPYITWGGDIATFHANGGLQTTKDSIYGALGLDLALVPGDDFVQQVARYVRGESPFLRGTFRMIGMASEAIGADPRTKGVVFMQMTWSAGDHMVAREGIRTVEDLRGKKIVLQSGGPHVGMLDDVLGTAQLGWNDVDIVWAKDLTGTPTSPAEMFRKQTEIAACFVITPDMMGLCGGLTSTGSGAEGTVRGSRVLISTADLSRSIADVYVCRQDFFESNRDLVRKFLAGYLKSCEAIVDLKRTYETLGSSEYMKILQLAQDIYGKDIIPTLEEDAHGLLSDCTFVGYPGNVTFFTEKNNLHGFEAFHDSALTLAVNQGYASVKSGLFTPKFDYKHKDFTEYLERIDVKRSEKFRTEAVLEEIQELSAGGGLDDRTIVTFTINFDPNQTDFSAVQYGTEYQRLVEMADKYGNAVFAIRGHSDPTMTLLDTVRAGMKAGTLMRSGTRGNYRYAYKGSRFDLKDTRRLIEMVEKGEFDGVEGHDPRHTLQAALSLSLNRAEAVRRSVIEYAQKKGLHLDKSQIHAVGVGIREPTIAKPENMDEARKNRRAEFRLLRVEAEAAQAVDFDF